MPSRVVMRSAALAACLTLLGGAIASADTVSADADILRPSQQTFIDLGTVMPGATVEVQVGFVLLCRNLAHVDPGTVLTLTPGTPVKPADATMTATGVTLGPVPADWPADGQPCLGDPEFTGTETSRVVMRAPASGGQTYTFSMPFERTPSDGLTGGTAVGFRMTVPANTPPTLDVPASFTVEGDTPGGWTAAYIATASDIQDDPDPAAVCSPAVGALVPLGSTTVSCTATDTAGLATSASFVVTVVDTVAPVLSGVPGDVSATASGAGGAVVTYATPGATDVVDLSPTVGCSPASGTTFPVGSTTVTCTATDASGNASSASFVVTVELSADRFELVFDEPVGNGGSLRANGSRTIPLKALVYRNEVEVTSGTVWVWLARCGGVDASAATELVRKSQRWAGHLDTSGLAGCYQVTVRSGGQVFGGFELSVDAATSAAKSNSMKKG